MTFTLAYLPKGINKHARTNYNSEYCCCNKECNLLDFISLIQEGKAITYWRKGTSKPVANKNHYRRTNETFCKTNFLIFDIDEGNIDTFIATHNDYAFIYTTPSHTNKEHRFRVVYALNKFITDSSELFKLTKYKAQIIGADEACCDSARLFYGNTKSIIVINKNITILSLDTIRKEAEEYWKNHPILTTKKCTVNKINRKKHGGNKLYDISRNKLAQRKLQMCRRLKEFIDNPTIEDHDGRLAITSNVVFFKDGFEIIRDALTRRDASDIERYENDALYIQAYYESTYCNDPRWGCSYCESCELFKQGKEHNVISLSAIVKSPKVWVRDTKAVITQSSTSRPTISINELRKQLSNTIEKILEDDSHKRLHIIKALCGSGKSTIMQWKIQEYLSKHPDKKVLILYKNHNTEEEANIGVAYPNAKKMLTKISQNIQEMYEYGLNPQGIIEDYCNNNPLDTEVIEYKSKFAAFNNAQIRTATMERFAITERLAKSDVDIIVFDEDPFDYLVKPYRVNKDFLKKVVSKKLLDKQTIFDFTGELQAGATKFSSALQKQIFAEVKKKWGKYTIDKESIKVFLELTKCDYLEGDPAGNGLLFMKNRLHHIETALSNKTVIITSATPFMSLYEKKFKDLEFYEFDDVEFIGRVTHYIPSMKTSKWKSQENIPKILEALDTDITNVMTFKNTELPEGYEKDKLYYGVETGSNKSKGKDAIIIGTPHLQPYTCKMFAIAAGYDFDRDKARCKRCTVQINGVPYTSCLNEDSYIRSLEIEHLQNKITQLLHRPRPLTEDVDVIVVVDLPLPGIPYQFLKQT
jgi:hypothetical protein